MSLNMVVSGFIIFYCASKEGWKVGTEGLARLLRRRSGINIFSGSNANFVSELEIARTRVHQGATNSTHRRIGFVRSPKR